MLSQIKPEKHCLLDHSLQSVSIAPVILDTKNSAASNSGNAVKPRSKIKKLIPELRRRKIIFSNEPLWYKRLVWRLSEDSQFCRSTTQAVFALLCVWIGVEYYLFATWGESNSQTTFFERPPGVEGFLPISALISLKYWIHTGIINEIHPSGLFILIAIVAIGLLMKKAFCSWLCPIGTLSESLWLLGKRLFGGNITLAKWLDYPLRSLKYLLLFFFAYSIWQMDVSTLKTFIYSPYNKAADIKMYLFFANISSFALWTIIILMLVSVFIKNFWCRYLCPYGALLGALSWLSPLKITRNKSTCIDCELCTKLCPSNIKVHKVNRVWSDECMSCLECAEACPVKNTLEIRASMTNTRIPSGVFAALIVGLFIAITGLGMLTGHWANNISKDEYKKHFQHLDSPLYQHNRGQVPAYETNERGM